MKEGHQFLRKNCDQLLYHIVEEWKPANPFS